MEEYRLSTVCQKPAISTRLSSTNIGSIIGLIMISRTVLLIKINNYVCLVVNGISIGELDMFLGSSDLHIGKPWVRGV